MLGGRGKAKSGCRYIRAHTAEPSRNKKNRSAHISATAGSIWTKLGVWKHRGRGQSKVGLPIILRHTLLSLAAIKKWKFPYLVNRWTDLEQTSCVGAWRQGHSKVRLPMHSEVYCLKTGSVVFSATDGLISTKVVVWLDTICRSMTLKKSGQSRRSCRCIRSRCEL